VNSESRQETVHTRSPAEYCMSDCEQWKPTGSCPHEKYTHEPKCESVSGTYEPCMKKENRPKYWERWRKTGYWAWVQMDRLLVKCCHYRWSYCVFWEKG
jgi:hypothetical protein